MNILILSLVGILNGILMLVQLYFQIKMYHRVNQPSVTPHQTHHTGSFSTHPVFEEKRKALAELKALQDNK